MQEINPGARDGASEPRCSNTRALWQSQALQAKIWPAPESQRARPGARVRRFFRATDPPLRHSPPCADGGHRAEKRGGHLPRCTSPWPLDGRVPAAAASARASRLRRHA
eukprot:scaffold20179_cov103-Isochrysis_galbana.AAC.1